MVTTRTRTKTAQTHRRRQGTPWLTVGSYLALLLVPQLLAAAQHSQLEQLHREHLHSRADPILSHLEQAHSLADAGGDAKEPARSYAESGRTHRNAVQKLRMLQRLRAAEWEVRTQAVEELLQGYAARHQACVAAAGLPGPYLLVRTFNNASGIGNQLPGVVTGFLLALLMERCFFVDFPFFNTHFEHELDFSWERHSARLLAAGHNASAPENEAELLPFGYGMIAETWMFKDMVDAYKYKYGVMLWRDLDYSAALLQSNPHHQEWIDRHFPTREIFAPLAAYLLRIAPRIEDSIAAFKAERFGLFTIGIQIRRKKCNGDMTDLHCELRPSIESFCQVARSVQLAHGLRDEDVKFFLAADEPATYSQVVQILGHDRVIFTDNGIAPAVIPDQVDWEDTEAPVKTSAANPGTLESALVDMALLSRCNDLVLTIASSYGYVAAAWGGIAPVHMVFGRHATSQNPFWFRAITSEPCFWQAKNMMKELDAQAVNRFQSNPFWMQYTQCHNDW